MTEHRQPYRDNPLLKCSYNLLAPLYDYVVARPLLTARKRSLCALPTEPAGEVLLSGIGTGLDLPLLPKSHHYTALDFSAAMLARAKSRSDGLNIDWVLGDSMSLPFPDRHYDYVLLHLILAVVPQPELCLSEAARVLKPGGRIILLDKFLHPQQPALLRRALNPLSRRLATRLDVVFEQVLAEVPGLQVESNTALLANGWFRGIVLVKR